jgi:hypothetical protein
MNGLEEMLYVQFADMILEHNKKYNIYLILYLLYINLNNYFRDQLKQDQLEEG